MPSPPDSKTAHQRRAAFLETLANQQNFTAPYPYNFLHNVLTSDEIDALEQVILTPLDLTGKSGERALHNEGRQYFDPENQARFPVFDALSQLFQHSDITAALAAAFDLHSEECYLRIEFAQDVDGFWLEPHTDIGVKLFSMLVYLNAGDNAQTLGTDIYDQQKSWVTRSPFEAGLAMAFKPSNITYHGFEARPIDGVRKSVIINYVTPQWRAREQLCFPDTPIALG